MECQRALRRLQPEEFGNPDTVPTDDIPAYQPSTLKASFRMQCVMAASVLAVAIKNRSSILSYDNNRVVLTVHFQ